MLIIFSVIYIALLCMSQIGSADVLVFEWSLFNSQEKTLSPTLFLFCLQITFPFLFTFFLEIG